MDKDDVYEVWLPVIGRALAQLCLRNVREGGTIGEKAKFLETLGLPRNEVAEMLGTSSASVTELLRRDRQSKKGARSNGRRRTR